MAWNTNELSPGNLLIEDAEVSPGAILVVGSIVLQPSGKWRVEIMQMHADDLRSEFADYNAALAFVEGVDRARPK